MKSTVTAARSWRVKQCIYFV